jgi:hypothetical protein
MPVHFLPSAIVHGLLLLLQLADTLPNGNALWDRTSVTFALLGVNSK